MNLVKPIITLYVILFIGSASAFSANSTVRIDSKSLKKFSAEPFCIPQECGYTDHWYECFKSAAQLRVETQIGDPEQTYTGMFEKGEYYKTCKEAKDKATVTEDLAGLMRILQSISSSDIFYTETTTGKIVCTTRALTFVLKLGKNEIQEWSKGTTVVACP